MVTSVNKHCACAKRDRKKNVRADSVAFMRCISVRFEGYCSGESRQSLAGDSFQAVPHVSLSTLNATSRKPRAFMAVAS